MVPADALREVVTVDYTRLTLVSPAGAAAAERVTLDLLLTFAAEDSTLSYPGVVVAEVKQARHRRSCFLDTMRELGLRAGSVSKYCLGVASLHARAKKNRYLPILNRLRRTADRTADDHAPPPAPR